MTCCAPKREGEKGRRLCVGGGEREREGGRERKTPGLECVKVLTVNVCMHLCAHMYELDPKPSLHLSTLLNARRH
jgi:hypothetical protein